MAEIASWKEGEMPEQDEDLQSESEFEDIPEDHPLRKALRASRADADRARKLAKVLVKHPQLDEDDFRGFKPDEFETRADKLVQRFKPAAASAEVEDQPEAEEEPPADKPVVREFQKMERTSTGDKVPEGKLIPRSDLDKMLRSKQITAEQGAELIRQGKVEFSNRQFQHLSGQK